MWALAAAGGLLVVLTRLLPTADAADVLSRVGPVLLFLVGITVVAELADAAGLFDVTARGAARLGRGRTPVLFLLVVAIGAVTTTLLSLDTTAVLLTPVVLALCSQLDLPALPFAMATVWLSNTTSLLLPVSNLTNLLALHTLDLGVVGFATRMALPALAALAVTVAVLGLRHRTALRGSYKVPEHEIPDDVVLLRAAAAVVAVFAALVLAELDVTAVALGCAAVLAAVFAWRRKESLRWQLVPWRLVLLVAGLFLVVQALQVHGLDRLLGDVAGSGTSYPDLLRLGAVSAVGANVVNNLPAYLALEPVAAGTDRHLALLLGVDLGPLVLLWGSLATLLWRERCRARGVQVGAREFALTGLVGVPLLLAASTGALLLTR
ncbi:MAG: SLC13 family permease [Motilibacteraceae bacterium]